MFRSAHNAVLQQYRNQLENSLNAYKSMPDAVELGRQQDVLAELSGQLQETMAQRDVAERQLSEKHGPGLRNDCIGYLSDRNLLSCVKLGHSGLRAQGKGAYNFGYC